MDMKNWNVDKTQITAQQEALKKSMNFAYVGHGPKATGLWQSSLNVSRACMRAVCSAAITCLWMPRARRPAFAETCAATSTALKAICPPLKWKSSRARSGKRAQKSDIRPPVRGEERFSPARTAFPVLFGSKEAVS